MTIHRAKGLEFDYVLVPGCGRSPRADGKPLLLWREEVDDSGAQSLVLAPTPTKGESPLYDYLHARDHDEVAAEAVRLLYVALTRARHEVHLFGHAKRNEEGTLTVRKGAFLALLWPAIATPFSASLDAEPASVTAVPAAAGVPRLRRIDPAALPAVADRKSTRLNSSHIQKSRMPSSA